MLSLDSKFKTVFSDEKLKDAFYRFLQVVFHLYPEDKFHYLITEESKNDTTDEAIYKAIQSKLSEIKPFLSELIFALPALRKQKQEMLVETLALLGDRKELNGYVEIGSNGRYISKLKKELTIKNNIYLINDIAPDNSPANLFERGQLKPIGTFIALENYEPISETQIASESIDLVTCYIGLHHAPLEKLDGFVKSIHRILRKKGLFILREHDVKTKEMELFVALVHTVFNLGLNESWEKDQQELRFFRSIEEWVNYLSKQSFQDLGKRLLQKNDPSDNTLIILEKV